MYILALSDIHGQTHSLPSLYRFIEKADAVVISGDITNFGDEEEASEVISRIREHNKSIVAVAGNCDYSGVSDYLSREGINLHGRCVVLGEYAFIGVGGSLPCPGRTPNEYTEKELGMVLEEAMHEVPRDVPLILVSHQPPYSTSCDRVGMGIHVGSRSLRSFIQKAQPLVCFSGHIHEGRGVDTIEKTVVANPGPLNRKGYVWAEVEGRSLSLKIMQDGRMLSSI